VGFVVDKVPLGQVFSEYFGFPANRHSTKFSIIIITRVRYNRSFSGRRAEWTQFGLHHQLCEFKKKKYMQIYQHCVSLKAKLHGCYVKMLIYVTFQFDIDN
jgi:hypothetical protein